MTSSRLLAAALLFAAPIARAQTSAPADLIVTNARIYTVDDSRPRVSALAVRTGRVLFAGSDREALALKGPSTRMIDGAGRTIIPGMIDAHAHLLGLGLSLRNVDLIG